MAAADSPCEPWITSADVAQGQYAPDVSPGSGTAHNEALLLEVTEAASAWLYRLSGRRYTGTCTTTVRPLWGPCGVCPGGEGWLYFDSRYGTYTTGAPQRSSAGYRQVNTYEITLGYYPVREITTVTIDGTVIDPSEYVLVEERWLQRNSQSWPGTQDLNLPLGSPGTWSVDFVYGTDVPPDGKFAARTLAGELVKAATGGDCRLPKRATNLVRQGVNISLVDPRDLLRDGRFGIPEVDAFLATVNPHGNAESASVMSVDIPRGIRRVGTLPGS